MLKLKDFNKNTILTSFDIPIKTTIEVSKPKKSQKKTGKQKFSKGQISKQAKKQGVKLPYKTIEKLSNVKQTKQQLKSKIYYQKRKQKEQNFKRIVKSQGVHYMEFVKRYVNLVKGEYERQPTKENLKRLHEAELLIHQARLYDERYRPYYKEIKETIQEKRIRLKKSRGAGNVSKPTISKAGTNMEDYVLNYFSSEVEEKVSEGMDESEAINQVFQEKIADGTLEVLQQYYDTGIIYGYWDEENLEVISPI